MGGWRDGWVGGGMTSEWMTTCAPLEAEAHLVGQGMQQQHRLAPGGVDLVPLHRDAGQPAQAEVVDGAELTAVPAPQGGQRNISPTLHYSA